MLPSAGAAATSASPFQFVLNRGGTKFEAQGQLTAAGALVASALILPYGDRIAWIAMVLTTFAVAVLRYGASLGWIWLQESYVWMHGIIIMVASGYALLHDAHVRVDIFYRPASVRFKAWVNLVGVVDAEQIQQVTIASPDQAIQGRVTGVQVTTESGIPGAPVAMRIRGVGTVGNTQPLFVVDGVFTTIGSINLDSRSMSINAAARYSVVANPSLNVAVRSMRRTSSRGSQITASMPERLKRFW